MTRYFVHAAPFVSSPFRVVYREASMTDPETGYPLVYTLKALEPKFGSAQEAQRYADDLNKLEAELFNE